MWPRRLAPVLPWSCAGKPRPAAAVANIPEFSIPIGSIHGKYPARRSFVKFPFADLRNPQNRVQHLRTFGQSLGCSPLTLLSILWERPCLEDRREIGALPSRELRPAVPLREEGKAAAGFTGSVERRFRGPRAEAGGRPPSARVRRFRAQGREDRDPGSQGGSPFRAPEGRGRFGEPCFRRAGCTRPRAKALPAGSRDRVWCRSREQPRSRSAVWASSRSHAVDEGASPILRPFRTAAVAFLFGPWSRGHSRPERNSERLSSSLDPAVRTAPRSRMAGGSGCCIARPQDGSRSLRVGPAARPRSRRPPWRFAPARRLHGQAVGSRPAGPRRVPHGWTSARCGRPPAIGSPACGLARRRAGGRGARRAA